MNSDHGAYPLRLVTLCTGIGGLDIAAEATALIRVVGQVEIDPKCVRVLERGWPGVPRARDIREVRGDQFGAVDILAAGIPCQPFSASGRRLGAADNRHLWPEMHRIIADERHGCWPTWVLIENVARFARVALDDVCADLEAAGYTWRAFVLPASAVGAPHERQRVFLLAHAERQRRPGQQDAAAGHHAERAQAGWEEGTGGAGESGAHGRSWASWLAAEPGLGGSPDGLPAWVDGLRWPAFQGQAQFEWEPPRTAPPRSIPERASRLKQLGNAVAPAHVYPIFVALLAAHAATLVDRAA